MALSLRETTRTRTPRLPLRPSCSHLPSLLSRSQLYEIGIESAVTKRLLPGGNTTTDQLIHQWLRLFNLDRSAMVQVATNEGVPGTEKKEREHKPTRKAQLNMELSSELNEKKMEADANKKKAQDSGANKQDKKVRVAGA